MRRYRVALFGQELTEAHRALRNAGYEWEREDLPLIGKASGVELAIIELDTKEKTMKRLTVDEMMDLPNGDFKYIGWLRGFLSEIDVVKKPSHYMLDDGTEVKDVMKMLLTREQLIGFYLGNIIKYRLRAEKKNGQEDLDKANEYVGYLKELLGNSTV